MIKNFFIIAYRNLKRNRIFSVINILGLATGMASAMLIFLWINDEMGFDRFHAKEDRLFQAYREDMSNGGSVVMENSPKILAHTLKTEFPEIEDVVRWQNVNFLLSVGDHHFNVPGNFTDSGFLNMFSFPTLQGIPNYRLNDPTSMVITESLAIKLFGKESAVGKQIRVDSINFLTVKAVLKDLPDNTQFRFDYLLPWSYMKKIGWFDNGAWENNSVRTFYTLKPGISATSFDAKIKNLIVDHTRHEQPPSNDILFGHPASKWHLYSKFENGHVTGGRISVVRLFSLIASFILLIACINFMNLSTARSEKRAREVGIRKVVGAGKSLLIWQFLAESLMFSLIAGLLAVMVVELSLPSFNLLVNKQLFIDFSDFHFWTVALGFVLLTGMLAGSYPAFYLSSFKPIKVLKGALKTSREGIAPRQFLVVLQFSFAIILIISTIVVLQQIRYAQNRDSGYERDNIVYNYMQGDINKNYEMIRTELIHYRVATDVTRTSQPMTRHWSDSWGFQWTGSNVEDEKTDFIFFASDINTISYPTDSNAMLLNETAMKVMRLKNPIGAEVRMGDSRWHVVGVIKDFILESPYAPIAPMIMVGPSSLSFYVLNMKLNPANSVSDNLKKAESIFKKYNPSYPFEYYFLDEDYASKFANEKQTGKLAALFAGLTIFISCLGLFGLSSFTAENRTKEIGIRKVLGASVFSITRLLSRDFIKLIILSFLIAAPFAWWAMNGWLQSYQYRISVSWWIFAVTLLLSVAIALITISFQSMKAALMNPAKSLRSE
jgi:ABC-type antimicrobial peptide transport system permease subunit